MRDANMLRSEHIPFNMFAPLIGRFDLAKKIFQSAFDIKIKCVKNIKIEFAPKPKESYLNDGTSFDVYVEYIDVQGKTSALGIEVKYTEREYAVGSREKENVENGALKYWTLTTRSGQFIDETKEKLSSDKMRQIWRNHLLGLAMKDKDELNEFTSITVYPSGNMHFTEALSDYHNLMNPEFKKSVIGCTFEKFINSIDDEKEILNWKNYLSTRYILKNK